MFEEPFLEQDHTGSLSATFCTSTRPSPANTPDPYSVSTFDVHNDEPVDLSVSYSRIKDTPLDRAIKESFRLRSPLPIIKEELRNKIRIARIAQGKPEIICDEEKPKTYKLREDEIRKRNVRLRQNRESALRSRERFKARENELLEKIVGAIEEKDRLLAEKEELDKQSEIYRENLESHLKVCPQHAQVKVQST